MRIDDADLATRLQALSRELLPPSHVEAAGRLLGHVAHAAEAVLAAGPVAVALLDDQNRPRAVASTGPAAAALSDAQELLQIGPGPEALASGDLIAVSDLAGRDEWAPLWRQVSGAGVRAVIALPIRVQEDVVGNLTAVADDPRDWTVEQRRAAESFADLVGQLLSLAASGAEPDTRDTR